MPDRQAGPTRLAVVEDEGLARRRMAEAFLRDGYEVEAFADGESFLARLPGAGFSAVLLGCKLPGLDGREVFRRMKALGADTEAILVAGRGSLDLAVAAIKEGVFHYAAKPVRLAEVRGLVREACAKVAMRQENRRLRRALREETGLGAMVGASATMRAVFALIRTVAPADCNVLVSGASGAGKALAARAIHQMSPRRERPLVSFDCGGFAEEILAGELFGRGKGAFPGAAARAGLLESARGGTVFLDEIGEAPASVQAKLLHAIPERSVRRAEGAAAADLDIRIIAATSRDPKALAGRGGLREDLLSRLSGAVIALPRLAERREDIPLLARHFVDKYGLLFRKNVAGVSDAAMGALIRYDFPGNVRELEDIVERAVALGEGDCVELADLPPDVQQMEFQAAEGEKLLTLDEVARRHVATVLTRTGGDKGLAARILGLPRTTLWRKLKQYGLD